jgi:hypothetical protein
VVSIAIDSGCREPADRQHGPVYCARRLLLSPTVLKRSAHPAGRWSLFSETKSFIVPSGCAFFHLEYKWCTYIPPAHPPKIPRNVWWAICPATPPKAAPSRQPLALAVWPVSKQATALASKRRFVIRDFPSVTDIRRIGLNVNSGSPRLSRFGNRNRPADAQHIP